MPVALSFVDGCSSDQPPDEQARLAVLQSQLEELEAVQACYAEHLLMAPVEQDNMRFAAAVVANCGAGGSASEGVAAAAASAGDVPALSGTLCLPGVCLAGEPVQLAFVLPKQGGAPGLRVHTNASRPHADVLQGIADATAAECAADGAPCLLLAADQVSEAARQLAGTDGEAVEQRQRAGEQPPSAGGAQQHDGLHSGGGSSGSLVLSRRCLVFHHIKNLNKRKVIVQWGVELGLGGWSKPGFPGVVLVEGEASDVAEYVSRLRHLRWQSMAVRAEGDVHYSNPQELEAARRVPRGVQELGEEEMGRLAAAARDAGVEHLFRVGLGLGPAAG